MQAAEHPLLIASTPTQSSIMVARSNQAPPRSSAHWRTHCFWHSVCLTLVLHVPTLVHAAPDSGEARCAITYHAPPACPGAAAMAEAAGPHFRVVPPSDPCPACVSRVTITAPTGAGGEYTLLSGDESTSSTDCVELVKIAGFTVRSSHIHHDPAPTPPFLFLGLHLGQVVAKDLQWVFGAQVGWRVFGDWLLRPHAGWTPESRVSVLINDDALDPRFTGYQAGLDVCRGVTGWASLCALSAVEWFKVSPTRDPGWEAPFANQAMFGLGATVQTELVPDLLVQLQPALLIAPRPARIDESDWSAALYERPQVQLQLRAGLAWGLGGNDPSDGSRSNFAQIGPARITH